MSEKATLALPALQPVYLPRRQTEDESGDDYDIAVAQNENVLNRNLETLYNGSLGLISIITDQTAEISGLEAEIAELRTTIATLQGGV